MLLWELSPGFFAFSGLYYDPEHSLVLAKSLFFFTSKSEQFCGFLYVFIFVLSFSKASGFCQTLFAISARSLLFFPLFPHLCQVLVLSFSDQSQNPHPLIPCWFLKYYLGYMLVHCHHRNEDWSCHHNHALIHHHLFFLSLPYLLLKFTF